MVHLTPGSEGRVIAPILQKRKLKLREMTPLAWDENKIPDMIINLVE